MKANEPISTSLNSLPPVRTDEDDEVRSSPLQPSPAPLADSLGACHSAFLALPENITARREDYDGDEVSSINSSIHYSSFRIVGTNPELQEQQSSETKETANGSASQHSSEHSRLPSWITGAPFWIKVVFLVSITLLLSSMILIGLGLALAMGGDNQASSSSVATDQSQEGVVNTTLPPVWATFHPRSPTIAPSSTSIPQRATATPTPLPTAPPSSAPTEQRTASPTTTIDPDIITFYLTGGRVPSNMLAATAQNLAMIRPRLGMSFMVHLGDWNSPSQSLCSEQSFQQIVELYNQSSVPVYFVMGDNEYNDCPNATEALALWRQYLIDYETRYWDLHPWTIFRQSRGFQENFAFTYRSVVFCGISLPGGSPHDAEELESRNQANLKWIDDVYWDFRRRHALMIIFAHDLPPGVLHNRQFFTTLFDRIRRSYTAMRILFIHRNGPDQRYGMEINYDGISNLDVLSVLGPAWPPFQVTIDTRPSSPNVTVNVRDWFDII